MGPIYVPLDEQGEEKEKTRKALVAIALRSDEFKGFKAGYDAGYHDARYGHTMEAKEIHVEVLFLKQKGLTWEWDRAESP